MFLARLASAAVLVPLVLAAVWLGREPLVLLAVLIAAWCTLEYSRLLQGAGCRLAWPVGVLSAGALAASPVVPGTHLGALALALAVLGPVVYYLAESAPLERTLQSWALTTLGSLAIGWPMAQGVALRLDDAPAVLLGWSVERGVLLALAALTITWACDSAAYLGGRMIGRTPFFPALSPRKTLEGAVSGVMAATAVALAWAPPLGWPLPFAIVLGAAGGVAAIAGDLLESALKRAVGAKDAGRVIPGHGGVLDRVDSLLMVLVAVALLTGEAWP